MVDSCSVSVLSLQDASIPHEQGSDLGLGFEFALVGTGFLQLSRDTLFLVFERFRFEFLFELLLGELASGEVLSEPAQRLIVIRVGVGNLRRLS
jgi:hypothetical protein